MCLFSIKPEYTGVGLLLWLPKGGAILEELEKLAKETEFHAGYVRVKTPHIAKEKMYLTSGHLPLLYKDSMFPPMILPVENQDRLKQDLTEVKGRIENLTDKMANSPQNSEHLQATGLEF